MPHVVKQVDPDESSYSFEDFLAQHKPQLEVSRVPELFWETLFTKLKYEVFDAGTSFGIMKEVYEDADETHGWKVVVAKEEGILTSDKKHIYLVDHTWTYETQSARQQLENMPALVDRMVDMMEIDREGKSEEQIVNHVMKESWRFCQTYSISSGSVNPAETNSVWYVMDEFGSRIQHSDDPSVRALAFFFIPQNISFTIFWPLKELENGAEVTRNYAEGEGNPDVRRARLLPWQPADFSDISYEQQEPSDSFFEAFRQGETEPDVREDIQHLPRDRSLTVFTDCHLVKETLTDIKFKHVDNPEEADILWFAHHFKDFRQLQMSDRPQWINQFPFEMVVNMKVLLAIVARRAGPSPGPRWLPVTYNLQNELPQFVSYFQSREEKELDNHWISKPWNLGRGLDMHVTADLNQLIRLRESGPKIACKYIEDPVLFYRDDVGLVKFDYRYVIMLAQVKPLKLYAHKVFWLRFANEPYSLDSLDNYQKHFTVMNYQEEKPLKQVHHDEFIQKFESQYPDQSWSVIEEDTFRVFTELFEAAGSRDPPKGIGHHLQSRALYAVDLMLKWDINSKGEKIMQPMLLEVNFAADNARATQYFPDFYNEVFSAMFCDEIEDRPIVRIS